MQVHPRRHPRSRTRRRPAASAGPIDTSARSPPHHGSNRCSSESNGSGSGRGSIGRRSGRSGSWSASSRSESWSAIVADGSPRRLPRVPVPDGGSPVPRPPRPDDLYRLRDRHRAAPVARWSAVAVVTVQTVAPGFDGYRDGALARPDRRPRAPRQLTLGARHDRHPRFSPDGRTLAFLSDRRVARSRMSRSAPKRRTGEDREDRDQIHLLPLDGGEARRLTDLPRGVDGFEWSPGRHRGWSSSARRTARRGPRTTAGAASIAAREPGTPPPSDYRFIDRLDYMLNGAGFTYDRVPHLWLVDVATGEATPPDRRPGRRRRAGLVARRHADRVHHRTAGATPTCVPPPDIHVVDVADAAVTGRHARPALDVRRADVAARRPDDRRARAPAARAGPAAATTSGCSPPTAPTRRRPAGRNLSGARTT